jgi:hypothetical protein
MKTILIKRPDITREYGPSKYRIRKAVTEGAITPYDGTYAGAEEIFYRTEIEAWVATLPPSALKHDEKDSPPETESV